MTPEERSKELIDDLPWQMDFEAWQQLRLDIADAIQSAIEAERERCLIALQPYDTGVLDYAAILAPVAV